MESNTCSSVDSRTGVRHTGGVARTRVRWDRLAVLATVVVATAGVAGRAAGSGGPAGGSHRAGGQRYVVRAGDTLWGIARARVGPRADPRPLVEGIKEANGLG